MKVKLHSDCKHLLNVHLTYRKHFSEITDHKIPYNVRYEENAESGHTATYLSRQGKDLNKILKTAASSLIWISTGQKIS